jgi:hypothetical protein
MDQIEIRRKAARELRMWRRQSVCVFKVSVTYSTSEVRGSLLRSQTIICLALRSLLTLREE